MLLASLVGAALASAGAVYQAVLRNPLADPYLLGASSGATLGTFLWALPLAGAAPLVGDAQPAGVRLGGRGGRGGGGAGSSPSAAAGWSRSRCSWSA